MVSPDWSSYVDLTIYDKTTTSILNESIAAAKLVIPEYVPEAGQTEVMLLEAMAYQTAKLVAAANRLPGATVETLLKLFGVTRSNGVKATATITVTAKDTAGYTIAVGTKFANFASGGSTYVYALDADLTIANGSSTATGAVTANAVGTAFNSPSNGDSLQILTTAPYVSSTVFASKPANGAAAETDATYFARATNLLQSYSSALTTTAQMETHVLANYGAAYRCKAHDKRRTRDRDTTSSTYTTHEGYVLVAVASENINGFSNAATDLPLSSAAIATIDTDLEDRTPAGLKVEVINAEISTITVTATVAKIASYASSTVMTSVTAALDNYLDPDKWAWSQSVRVNEIISLLDQVDGVDYVTSVSLAATGNATVSGDVTLTNLGTLTVPGTHVITVT